MKFFLNEGFVLRYMIVYNATSNPVFHYYSVLNYCSGLDPVVLEIEVNRHDVNIQKHPFPMYDVYSIVKAVMPCDEIKFKCCCGKPACSNVVRPDELAKILSRSTR